MIVYKTWIKHFARYEGWFLLGFILCILKLKDIKIYIRRQICIELNG